MLNSQRQQSLIGKVDEVPLTPVLVNVRFAHWSEPRGAAVNVNEFAVATTDRSYFGASGGATCSCAGKATATPALV